ncbi:hypothetical protein Q5P01_015237 [Channa striata]|uniref:Arrestin C-terminal-like domain-containing protein n=1 Tax=Channa striata TaxID=64152 RepID=A0AA88SG59_CHASR|nr:hypothetical protein Q5P01_015237 [Channa striata]
MLVSMSHRAAALKFVLQQQRVHVELTECSGTGKWKVEGPSFPNLTKEDETVDDGDTLTVTATVCNSSSKTMRPKFTLVQRIEYHTSDTTNSAKTTLNKVVGETLAQNSEETVSCRIMIPRDATYTLKNCDIISVDYFLKVNLDIPFAIGPVAMFPLVVISSSLAALQPDGALGPHPAGSVGGPSFSDQLRDPAPAAPRLFQHGEEPPSYMSLFPTSQDNQQQQ